MFHCHLEFHVELGMAVILKVGSHSEFPPVPNKFPRCGNYISPPLSIRTLSSGEKDNGDNEIAWTYNTSNTNSIFDINSWWNMNERSAATNEIIHRYVLWLCLAYLFYYP